MQLSVAPEPEKSATARFSFSRLRMQSAFEAEKPVQKRSDNPADAFHVGSLGCKTRHLGGPLLLGEKSPAEFGTRDPIRLLLAAGASLLASAAFFCDSVRKVGQMEHLGIEGLVFRVAL